LANDAYQYVWYTDSTAATPLGVSCKNRAVPAWPTHLGVVKAAKGLGDIIAEGNEALSHDKLKLMIFLHHHLDEGVGIPEQRDRSPRSKGRHNGRIVTAESALAVI
ncbi:hypothetical protein HAX54_008278, partial [Datura stramonium]|nr:hypothetical protein [Datura stramonium]